MLWWLFVVFFVLPVVLVILMSYYSDKEYWKRRVQEGGWSWEQFRKDVDHYDRL